MQRLSRVSIRVGRVVVYTVEYGSSVIVSARGKISFGLGPVVAVPSGGAQWRGVPSGRARPRTAWITFEECMMFRGRSSRPA